ncbi:MAG: hypothetical protein WC438_05885 [Candidatus Pacearchaeota archaeon]
MMGRKGFKTKGEYRRIKPWKNYCGCWYCSGKFRSEKCSNKDFYIRKSKQNEIDSYIKLEITL